MMAVVGREVGQLSRGKRRAGQQWAGVQGAAQSPALFISVDQTSAGLREIQLIHT